MQFIRTHQIPLLFFGIGLLLITYIMLLRTSDASPHLNTEQITTRDYEQLSRQLTLITERHNPREAFSLLRRNMKEHKGIVSSCHGLAHGMGHAAYMKYQDFGKAMENREELCNAGYTHGVIEAYFSDIENFRKEVVSLCDEYIPGTFTRAQCDHGIGHGIMFATQNDLPESIKICETLPRDDARDRCYHGVFMENVMADQQDHVTRYLRSNDPEYPCTEVQDAYKQHCYGYVPTSYLTGHPGDYAGVLTFCEGVDHLYKTACAQGVGSRVIVEQIDHPEAVISLCMSSIEHVDACLLGMIQEYVNHHASIEPAMKLCRVFPEQKQSLCIDTVRQKSVLFNNRVPD